jgi:type IV secretory pathway VirB2 component (pilin)
MWMCDTLQEVLAILQGVPLDQAAMVAVVTIVTAGIVYLLFDAWSYRAIPDLIVSLTPGT